MEEVAEKASKNVDCAEKDLAVLVAHKEPIYASLEPQLARLRTACQDFAFVDFDAATEARAETRLWEAHAKVNQKFRSFLAKFRDGDGKKKHVERRKAEKLYLEFIKSSMKFYRGYIQRLASHFRDVPEILEVAMKFSLESEFEPSYYNRHSLIQEALSAEPIVPINDLRKKQIVRSCYLSLVQLGDLSRYRETELQTKERDWGPAKGYYQLAIKLDPHSGVAYNQLAVIALTDQDHLRAVYYLYRAITVHNFAPQAPGNLELEFKKIRTRASQGLPISPTAIEDDNGLSDHFIIYHSRCAERGFVIGDDQQNEIFRRLADDLREKPFDTRVRMFCLINIAAEDVTAQKAREDGSLLRTYQVFQQLNVGTFFLLMKLMLDELQRLAKGSNTGTTTDDEKSINVTPVTRRILPHLRLYSSWLLSKADYLLASETLKVQMREFWLVYAEALSLLTATYSLVDILEIPYLLDEDLDTLGFSPFSDLVQKNLFYAQDQAKLAYDEVRFGPRSPETEMLYRIKCLVKDGVILCRGQCSIMPIPLKFAGMCFVFVDEDDEDGRPSTRKRLVSPHETHTSSINSISREDIEAAKQSRNAVERASSYQEDASDAGVSVSATSTMENMVNNLTQPELPRRTANSTNPHDESLSSVLKTPTAQSFAERGVTQSQSQLQAFTAQDLVQQIQRSPRSSFPSLGDPGTNRPMIPSIMNSPFAPLPGETPGSSPRASTVQRLHAPFVISPQTRQFQVNLLQQQQQVQIRSSPFESPQSTMLGLFETPSNMTARMRAADPSQPVLSPWQDSPYQPVVSEAVVSKRAPEPAPFGAIGDPRPKSSGAPTSGQFG